MHENEFKKAVQSMKENEKYLIEVVVFVAKTNRLYFEELLNRGFNENQAMVLVIETGMTLSGRGENQ